MTSRRLLARAAAALAMLLAGGCAGGCAPRPAAAPSAARMSAATANQGPARTAAPAAGSARATPAHRRSAAARLPRFFDTVSGPLSAKNLPFSWHLGCPVPPRQLRATRLSYIGFDGTAHRGEIIVNVSVVAQVIKVFSILYRARFPIRRMEPVDAFHGSDPRSMAADNTSGFNCRRAVAPGPPQWSMHAYGLAIDVNTVQNPYLEAGAGVKPPAGAAYLDRADIRPGMAYQGGILVSAFASVGWAWGGIWAGTPDYQHFSVNGH